MKQFVGKYLPDKELKILDLGSRVVDNQISSYKELFTNKKWHYIGADVEPGKNVDVVMKDGYKFPFNNEEFDIVISGQTIEHMEFPWIWFLEMQRILKQEGICCIIAPAVIAEHKYPIDTFRYYPDGMKALAKWSKLEVLEVKRIPFLEEYTGAKEEDTFLIAKKAKIYKPNIVYTS